MPLFKKSSSRRHKHNNWRDYQSGILKNTGVKSPERRPALRTIIICLLVVIAVSGLISFVRNGGLNFRSDLADTTKPLETEAKEVGQLSKEQLRLLLSERTFSQLTQQNLAVPAAGNTFHIKTTLDPDLQNFLLSNIDRQNSRYVGIVVMEASTGKVLALAGFDRTDSFGNPCLRSEFPAASIFKIVTAATAVDQCGYSPDSPMQYSGSKHTLYKRQLTNKVDRYTTTIPFREAFADSINPVFGKLGELRLRKPLLEEAAATFGFNQPLDFEIPLPPSQFQISDNPYNWAEIASGFNLETTLSPLHGAALAGAILNSGKMITPSIIESMIDDQGNSVYRQPATPESRQIMSPRAATALKLMMETTMTSGTARKSFRKHKKEKVLTQLEIGGKTGSIDSKSHDVRYDWFVGFARQPHGRKQIVVAAMVGHEKFIGIRATDYALRAMNYYFSN